MSTARTGLLDPKFLSELEALRRQLRPRGASGASGERVAAQRGSSAEFREHRGYVPGDDLRRIDWLAFARTGTPVVKQFHAEQDVVLRLLLDASASFGMGEPSKLDHGKRIGAALSYMALRNAHRAQLARAASRDKGEVELLAPVRGQTGLVRLLDDLDRTRCATGLDLPKAVQEIVRRASRPGVIVVLSDFLDPGPLKDALRHAAFARHELVLVQILHREELNPTFDGDLVLEDIETGATVDVTADAGAIAAYRRRLHGLFGTLADVARLARGTYVRTTPEEELGLVVRRIVRGGIEAGG